MTPKGGAVRPDFSLLRGRRVLIALSGGADSVALAVLLAEARESGDLELFAAHLDHGIRAESAGDALFCEQLCQSLDIPLLTERVDIPAEARQRHTGVETLARLRRHEWLERCRLETRSDYIALAHHMDDQAETVLMHLGRGSGPEGACGMRSLSGVLYRPLLGYRKSELVDFLKSRGYGWREDATNAVGDTPRNALRLNVIPELEKCYPQFVRAVARFCASQQIESDYLERLTEECMSARSFVGPGLRWLELSPALPRALLRRALRRLCPAEIRWEQLNALEALCAEDRGRLSLGADLIAERAGHRIYLIPGKTLPVEPVPLSLSGMTRVGGLCEMNASPCPPIPIRDDPLRQALRAGALEGAVVRTRREGDRIRPLGGGDRLLSDYLTDKKIDRPLRDRIALVAVGSRVHWVCGLGISQEAALGPGDRAIRLECEYDPNNGYNGGNDHAK